MMKRLNGVTADLAMDETEKYGEITMETRDLVVLRTGIVGLRLDLLSLQVSSGVQGTKLLFSLRPLQNVDCNCDVSEKKSAKELEMLWLWIYLS